MPRYVACPSGGMPIQLTLCAVPVFFATSEGQTRRIAERLAAVLRNNGLDSVTYDVADLEHAAIDWTHVSGAILGASLHAGKHQSHAHAFASSQASRLNARPSMFFSVSLAAASQDRAEVEQAQALANGFPAAHDWRPQVIASLAGRLAYTQYGFLKRLIMKRIARKEGAPTDASRDTTSRTGRAWRRWRKSSPVASRRGRRRELKPDAQARSKSMKPFSGMVRTSRTRRRSPTSSPRTAPSSRPSTTGWRSRTHVPLLEAPVTIASNCSPRRGCSRIAAAAFRTCRSTRFAASSRSMQRCAIAPSSSFE